MSPKLGDRSLFPTLEAGIYLNHAAVSPLSTPVLSAAQAALDAQARLGAGAIGPAMQRREAVRAQVAGFLGAQAEDIGFAPGTTRGISDLALAIPWRSGDRILCFEGEFPSNVLPWQTVATRFGLTVERLPLGDDAGLSALEAALRVGPARLVAVSTVQFQTGLRMPVAEMARLAHAAGAELFVDAIQALGGLPVHVDDGFDYLVAGTHKWLMGLDGLAVAYASPRARAGLQPLTAGWLSTEEPLRFLFEGAGHLRYDRPVRAALDWMEVGVMSTAPFDALAASLALIEALGTAQIAAHVQAWHDAVEPGLVALGFVSGRSSSPSGRSNTLSLRPPPGVALGALAAAAATEGVAVSTPDGWLRLSPHWPNALDEAPRLVEAMARALHATS